MAGKRQGQEDIERVYALTRWIADPQATDPRTVPADDEWADPRSRLVTEPIRWALDLKPTFLAWEQVPPVLGYWRLCAEILRERGYSVWAGLLSAERFGVPQTRKRAILMASLAGPVESPRPTHQAYVAGEPAWEEPQVTLEGEIKPWVSMADALGWANDDATGSATNLGAGMLEREKEAGGPGKRTPRPATEPGPHITGTTRRWARVKVPAPTVTAGGTDAGGPEPFSRGGRQRLQRAICEREATE